ncbi:MAG TPA: DNA primase [Pirellulales bacterium]|nr:DNA primase [Pirellulales bacterium]
MSQGSTFDSTKEQVKRSIDIVELVGEYIPLRREGRGYKGLCPWHDDSRPSLQVHPDRQTFHCWVCNIGGDIFSFIEKREGVSFKEALAMLAERAGVRLTNSSGQGAGEPDQKRMLYQAAAWAEQQFHECLMRSDEGDVARRYLKSRGITDDSARRHHLGFAPNQWDWLLKRARETRFTPPLLHQIGLVKERQQGQGFYDFFRGRVMFSIRDVQGRPVATGGRLLPDLGTEGAKYINTPETPLFSKSNLLYGLDVAKDAISKGRAAMVMEGYTDCIIAQQCGLENAVAVLGTALGERHIRLLRRFADRIDLVLDGDEAGRKRTDEILELFVAEQVDLRILTLPNDLDPADFLLQQGAQAFLTLLRGAVDALEHKFRQATASLHAASGTHEANQALEQVLATLAKAPRLQMGGSTATKLREDQILSRLAHLFGLAEERIRKRLADLRTLARRGAAAAPARAPAAHEPKKLLDRDYLLLEILLQSPEWMAEAQAQVAPEELRYPKLRAIYAKCGELCRAGILPSFDRLLLEIDDGELKTVLVELDEAHHAKNRPDRSQELSELLAAFRETREQRSQAQRKDAIREAGEEEALDTLRDIIERKRRRQGISEPTDG